MPPKRRGGASRGGGRQPAAKRGRGKATPARGNSKRAKHVSTSEEEAGTSDVEDHGFNKNRLQEMRYDFDQLLEDPTFNHPELVEKIDAAELNMEYYEKTGLDRPLLFHCDARLLGMTVPDRSFTVNDVVALVGGNRMIEVVQVSDQSSVKMSLEDFVKFYTTPASERKTLYNVLSLEFSQTPMQDVVKMPELVRKVDWVQNHWPDALRTRYITYHRDKKHYTPHSCFPNVQRYCLMSVANCYTDFHIDFSGTSVWYHVLRGQKVFWMIPPTETNFLLYEEFSKNHMDRSFFGKSVEVCHKVVLNPGDTMLIPSGWLHAVYTPVDSLVFGGNFVHSLSCRMQIRVSQCENRLNITRKFRLPYNIELMFYVIADYLKKWTGREYARPLRIEDSEKDYVGERWIAAGGHLKKIEYADYENGKQLQLDDDFGTGEEGEMKVIAMHAENTHYKMPSTADSSLEEEHDEDDDERASSSNAYDEQVDELVRTNPLVFYRNSKQDFTCNKSVPDHRLPIDDEPPIDYNQEALDAVTPRLLVELEALVSYLRKKAKLEIAEGICKPSSLLNCFTAVLSHRREQLEKDGKVETLHSGRKHKSTSFSLDDDERNGHSSQEEAKPEVKEQAIKVAKQEMNQVKAEDVQNGSETGKSKASKEEPAKDVSDDPEEVDEVKESPQPRRRSTRTSNKAALTEPPMAAKAKATKRGAKAAVVEETKPPTRGSHHVEELPERLLEDDDDDDDMKTSAAPEYVPTPIAVAPAPSFDPKIFDIPKKEHDVAGEDEYLKDGEKEEVEESEEAKAKLEKEQRRQQKEKEREKKEEQRAKAAKEAKARKIERSRNEGDLVLDAAHGNIRKPKKKPEKPQFVGGVPVAPIQEAAKPNPYNFDPMSEIVQLGTGQLKSAYRKSKSNIELPKERKIYKLETRKSSDQNAAEQNMDESGHFSDADESMEREKEKQKARPLHVDTMGSGRHSNAHDKPGPTTSPFLTDLPRREKHRDKDKDRKDKDKDHRHHHHHHHRHEQHDRKRPSPSTRNSMDGVTPAKRPSMATPTTTTMSPPMPSSSTSAAGYADHSPISKQQRVPAYTTPMSRQEKMMATQLRPVRTRTSSTSEKKLTDSANDGPAQYSPTPSFSLVHSSWMQPMVERPPPRPLSPFLGLPNSQSPIDVVNDERPAKTPSPDDVDDDHSTPRNSSIGGGVNNVNVNINNGNRNPGSVMARMTESMGNSVGGAQSVDSLNSPVDWMDAVRTQQQLHLKNEKIPARIAIDRMRELTSKLRELNEA